MIQNPADVSVSVRRPIHVSSGCFVQTLFQTDFLIVFLWCFSFMVPCSSSSSWRSVLTTPTRHPPIQLQTCTTPPTPASYCLSAQELQPCWPQWKMHQTPRCQGSDQHPPLPRQWSGPQMCRGGTDHLIKKKSSTGFILLTQSETSWRYKPCDHGSRE